MKNFQRKRLVPKGGSPYASAAEAALAQARAAKAGGGSEADVYATGVKLSAGEGVPTGASTAGGDVAGGGAESSGAPGT